MLTYRLVLNGLGNVGLRFLNLIRDKSNHLEERYGIRLLMVGCADSTGAIYDPQGLDLRELIACKDRKQGIATLPGSLPGQTLAKVIEEGEADLMLEAAPTNCWTGEPGLSLCRQALQKGLHVVMASKGALVVAWDEMVELSELSNPGKPALRFSGTVGGCLPSVNLGWRDLAGCHIKRMEGVLNLSTGILLSGMEAGRSLDEVILEAQAAGLAEADPSLDVDGWDAAAKLCILANALLHQPTRMTEIPRKGLRDLEPQALKQARSQGRRTLLMAKADWDGKKYQLEVLPQTIGEEHPFYRLAPGASGLLYETDIQGVQTVLNTGQGPMGTSAAMLRDVIDILKGS